MRTPHIVGNWKMNLLKTDIEDFFRFFNTETPSCKTWIAPQSIHIPLLLLRGGAIEVGAQNCSHQDSGALTGEVSPKSLKDIGAHFVIIGHSERRQFYGEDHDILNQKTQAALANGLAVIFCVGEKLEERQRGETESVIKAQLDQGLKGIEASDGLLIAYEPVWAIGTGKTASPEQAQAVHRFIRDTAGNEETVILYGGSANPSNAEELLQCPDIDGALVGGASLKGRSFADICRIAESFAQNR